MLDFVKKTIKEGVYLFFEPFYSIPKWFRQKTPKEPIKPASAPLGVYMTKLAAKEFASIKYEVSPEECPPDFLQAIYAQGDSPFEDGPYMGAAECRMILDSKGRRYVRSDLTATMPIPPGFTKERWIRALRCSVFADESISDFHKATAWLADLYEKNDDKNT